MNIYTGIIRYNLYPMIPVGINVSYIHTTYEKSFFSCFIILNFHRFAFLWHNFLQNLHSITSVSITVLSKKYTSKLFYCCFRMLCSVLFEVSAGL